MHSTGLLANRTVSPVRWMNSLGGKPPLLQWPFDLSKAQFNLRLRTMGFPPVIHQSHLHPVPPSQARDRRASDKDVGLLTDPEALAFLQHLASGKRHSRLLPVGYDSTGITQGDV